MSRIHVAELEAQAHEVLPERVFDFVAAAAGAERSLADNAGAWQQWKIRPRVLRGVAEASTAISVQGLDLDTPILLSPTGRQRGMHPDGEVAAARAAAAKNTIYTLATSATADLHEVATTGAHLWQQLYISTDRDWTSLVVNEAAASGFHQIVVTVDRAREAHRPRAARHGGMGPLPDGVAVTSHRGDGSTRSCEPGVWDATITWQTITEIAEQSTIPVAVKGVLHPDDARRAVDAGAAAIVVSNHGGRQLDAAIPTAEALPDIITAVDGQVPVYVDGGIRTGTDAFRALALGASAILIGRPYVWALAVGGQSKVEELITSLTDDLAEVMTLAGCGSVDEITPDHLYRYPRI